MDISSTTTLMRVNSFRAEEIYRDDILPQVKVKHYHFKCLICNERILDKNEFGLCFYCKLAKRTKHYN